jgi:hypothetical protein
MKVTSAKEMFLAAQEIADNIMDGGENYDGADGAREVQSLCATGLDMITALEKAGIETI